MNDRRRWEEVGDFARGLSLAGFVAFSSFAAAPERPLAALAVATTHVALPAARQRPSPVEAPRAEPDRIAILERGQSLGELLRRVGLAAAEFEPVVRAAAPHLNPRQLAPGLRLEAFEDGGQVIRLQVALAGRGELAVRRLDGGWSGEFRPYRKETRVRSARGVLSGTLDRSLVEAGAPPELAHAMADVLQWDLDFTRDLRNGDRFEALFEEELVEGVVAGLGRVLALHYRQTGRDLEVYRYGPGDAYYDASGRPIEKMFLRAPLPYSRVTSRFSARRFHPVLKVARPHYGVDYGAPVGTPVRVTAAGTVELAAWSGGGGKTVKVRHGNGYQTAYLHLSRYAEGIRRGARVRQGEIIGYVGSTGLATGPHLDYRVQHHGRWIDPQSLKSVPAEPLTVAALGDFARRREAMRIALAGEAPYREELPFPSPSPTRVAAARPAAAGSGAPVTAK